MAPNIIDITKHPYDPASILEWALDIWELHPTQALLIITQKGDGAALDNRLRVKLSLVRSRMRNQHGEGTRRFSIASEVIRWAKDARGEQACEALCLQYMIRSSHVASDALDALFSEKMK